MIQRAVEEVGISTVSITLVESLTKKIKPPRALAVPYGFGHPLGEPNNPELQHAIIAEALSLLENGETPPILKVAGTPRVP
ncbi:hypothetical protein F4009_04380 [Candidatus Poribacteria bacterium]|nr:hypothetical protein [Candidatus Poribacteria bacterium]MYH82952.1 hypothetical protein [Candidatus Poribacteria bacterium]MYK93227.1 hypothetical protein [Candidatus Poribacteria bacterium]